MLRQVNPLYLAVGVTLTASNAFMLPVSTPSNAIVYTAGGIRYRVYLTEYIFYCKRAILFLSSSKILTPHPPLRPASLSSPRNKAGGTHSLGGEGDGGSIFWKTREIGLASYSKICTLWVHPAEEVGDQDKSRRYFNCTKGPLAGEECFFFLS